MVHLRTLCTILISVTMVTGLTREFFKALDRDLFKALDRLFDPPVAPRKGATSQPPRAKQNRQRGYGQHDRNHPGMLTGTFQPGDFLMPLLRHLHENLGRIIDQSGVPSTPREERPKRPRPAIRFPEPEAPPPFAVEQKVVDLTNAERKKHGLKPFRHNFELSGLARMKSADMRDLGYFDHESPTYGRAANLCTLYGVKWKMVGENIAAGHTSAEDVVIGWMNSPGHRANILSDDYSEIGVGYAMGGRKIHYWTQMFIEPRR